MGRMERVLYILGAGFSAPLGLPLVSDFLMKSKDQYFDNPTEYDHFREIFEEIDKLSVAMKFFQADLFNIEEVLSFLEMKALVSDDGLRDRFLRYVRDVICHHTPEIVRDPECLRSGNWYEHLFGSEGHYGALVATSFGLRVARSRLPSRENASTCGTPSRNGKTPSMLAESEW